MAEYESSTPQDVADGAPFWFAVIAIVGAGVSAGILLAWRLGFEPWMLAAAAVVSLLVLADLVWRGWTPRSRPEDKGS